jgi:predicted aminopeptidase
VVLEDAATPSEQRVKLTYVKDARRFAQQLGLSPGDSFTKFTQVDRDTLAWVVMAARRDSFALRSWWFPIVGSVPYKGFFDEQDARDEGAALTAEGYEAWVRGTEAFSTLGWFNDPVLSTTLTQTPARIINTVVHESVHTTVWIKNNVPFNESLANFIGSEGALEFADGVQRGCVGAAPVDRCADAAALRSGAQRERDLQYELSDLITQLYTALEKVYTDATLTSAQKLERRVQVFAQVMAPFRARYPGLQILKEVNNAEIMQLKLYLSDLMVFHTVFEQCGRSWAQFLEVIRGVQAAVEHDGTADPFAVLRASRPASVSAVGSTTNGA